MRIFRQGDLDGLCGVYSIVNAARVVSRLTPAESAAMFERLVRRVGNARRVADGLGRGGMDSLLRDVADGVLSYRRTPFRARNSVPLSEFWAAVREFLADPPDRAGAVIVRVDTARWSHWTTIVAATDRRIRLLDSDGRKALDRRRCTTGPVTSIRPYRLWPTDAYFLS